MRNRKISKLSLLRTAVVALLIVGMAGCASLPPDSESFPPTNPPTAGLRVGDLISVEFAYANELNTEQIIRPDGKVALQYIGDVQAAGRTPDEVRTELLQLYTKVLKQPELTVVVREYRSHLVYVLGEVSSRGPVSAPGPISVWDAIALAGGELVYSARMDSVLVIRRQGGTQYVKKFDLTSALTNSESEPFFLEPYDIVYVPRTHIDRANQWVDQHVDRIIPENFLFQMDYGVGGRERH